MNFYQLNKKKTMKVINSQFKCSNYQQYKKTTY